MAHWTLITLLLLAVTPDDLDTSTSEMRPFMERYITDRQALSRRYDVPMSTERRERMRRFYEEWQKTLEGVRFDSMSSEGKVDWLLFAKELRHELRRLDHEEKRDEEVAVLLPFAPTIVALAEGRRDLKDQDPESAAGKLDGLRLQLEQLTKNVKDGGLEMPGPALANRAAERADWLKDALKRWFKYYDGYDPLFTWWVKKPWQAADRALGAYAAAIRAKVKKDVKGDLIGDPIGREALLDELEYEMIPYTPEELIRLARRELSWCDAEMGKAAKELGFPDWKAAQEHVKTLHVEPGAQPALIRDLAREATAFVTERDLVTVPDLCKEVWRMEMMSPERQRMSPYFLGGETIRVAFPTADMAHADKRMSLRGNNRHFVRAVVHHELIPGHHLQGFMAARYNTHRRPFSTPFYIEGWALYWELYLWDLGFCRTPEDRIGMLFWRKHRCARIIFSLSYHLGEMTAKEAVDFLVDRVGHERNNATAEVRRSISGGYGPLYQAAYLLGGLQLRALHRELVGSGEMKDREFHDAVLRENGISIELIRAHLLGQKMERGFSTTWRFYELPPEGE